MMESEEMSAGGGDVSQMIAGVVTSLNAAKTDTEKFAALLLVPRLVKADHCKPHDRRQVFDAIGFPFLIRLLHSKSDTEADVYKSVSLSVLSAFVTDEELAIHPKMLVNIPVFIVALESSDLALAKDAYDCLCGIAQQEKGRAALVECNAVERLCNIYTVEASKQAYTLISAIISSEQSANTSFNEVYFSSFMEHLAVQFHKNNTEYKFHLCDMITAVLLCIPQRNVDSNNEWVKFVYKGLGDVLTSKIGSEQRNPALKLSAAMFNLFGQSWILDESSNEQQHLFVVTANLACVEVRMILEDRDFQQICNSSSVLISCYVIVENVIMCIVNEADSKKVSQKAKQQLYGALKGAANAIFTFLLYISKENNGNWKELNDTKISLLYASIRVICAWLAEETEALRQEVFNILPFLLDIVAVNCKAIMSLTEKSKEEDSSMQVDDDAVEIGLHDPDLLRLLLPALCHLSSEDTSLNMMLSSNTHHVLATYMRYHWLRFAAGKLECSEESDDSETALVTLCGVFMNIVVVRPDCVQADGMFNTLCKFVLSRTGDIERKPQRIMLLGNLCVLGLLLLRHVDISEDCNTELGRCIMCVTRFLWGAHERIGVKMDICSSYRAQWEELGDLWFVGMSTLTHIIQRIPWIIEFIRESGWLQDIIQTLAAVKQGNIEDSILSAYQDFLCSLLTQDKNLAHVIVENDGRQMCQTHNLTTLNTHLN